MRQQPSEMLWCLPSGACFGPTPSTTIYGVAMLIINYESPITNYYSPLGVLGVLGGSPIPDLHYHIRSDSMMRHRPTGGNHAFRIDDWLCWKCC
jgi:hypothetical protein